MGDGGGARGHLLERRFSRESLFTLPALFPNRPLPLPASRNIIVACACPDTLSLLRALPHAVVTDPHALALRDLVRAQLLANGGSCTSNVLCRGIYLRGGGDLHFAQPNALLAALHSHTWRRVHEAIGTAALRILLARTSVFVPMSDSSGGLLQVSGAPFSQQPPLEKSPQKGSAPPRVNRWKVFYSVRHSPEPGLPRNHVLLQMGPRAGGSVLTRILFEQNSSKKRRLHRRYRSFEELVATPLLHKAQRFNYAHHLRHFCPLPHRLEEICEYEKLLPTPPYQVLQFVWTSLRGILPMQVWGSRRNRRQYRVMCEAFICKMRRYESFSVGRYSCKIRLKETPWLAATRSPNQHSVHEHMVQQWVAWMMNELVIPLISNHFYVTETGDRGQVVVYYRKPVWQRILTVERKPMLAHSAGIPPTIRARLIPSSSKTRLIGSMPREAKRALETAHHILKWETQRHPHLLGASIFSLANAHEKLFPFKERHQGKRFYIVQYDYSDAYDRILKQKLLDMVPSLFSEPLYALQYYAAVPKGANARTEYTARVIPAREISPLQNVRSKGRVVVDWSSIRFVTREEVIELIRQHILHHEVRLGGKTFCQEEGIPQGSPLSAMLCSLFYAHMERTHFSFLGDSCTSDSCWMRLIDDGLFITTDLPKAERFSSILQSEQIASQYGTVINAKKSHLDPASNGERVVWCGLRIETDTLECCWDVDRLYRIPVKDTLTVSGFIVDKMRLYVQARRIPLVLTTFSSVSSLLVHLAHKFVAYMGELPRPQGGEHNPVFLIHALQETLLHVSRLTPFPLEAYALGVGAFEGVMRRHGGRWREVLGWLEREKRRK